MPDSLSIGSLNVTGGTTWLGGIGSDLDTEALIAAAYAAKRQPAVRLEQRIAHNEAKLAALGELQSLLSQLKAAADGLRNPPGLLGARNNAFEAKQVFLSSTGPAAPEEILGVSVDNSAQAGGIAVEVRQLATADKLSARTVAAEDQTLADAWNGGADFAGTLELGLAGGSTARIGVSGGMTIHDLRAAINGVSAQTGVSATVLNVSDSDFRLVLTGRETNRAIELVDAGGDPITSHLGTTQIQAAGPAVIRVDGIELVRDGNRIDDVLPGLTLDLYRAEAGTDVTVQIEPSLARAKEQILTLVDAYNGLRTFVAKHTAVTADGMLGEDAVLFGDRTLRSVAQSLGGLIGGSVAGLGDDSLRTLRDVGITFTTDGRLQIDEAKLDNKLLVAPDQVRALFEFVWSSSSPDLRVHTRTNELADTGFTVAISDPDADGIPDAATIDGQPAEISGSTIKGAAGTPHAGLTLLWAGRGDASIEVAATQGLADRLYNALETVLAPVDGPIQRAIGSLATTNGNYAGQLERINERAEAARTRLIERFSAMETALAMANTMLAQIRAQMDAMNATG